jgi:hypothetical protein
MIRVSLSLLQTAEDRDFDPWRSLDALMLFRGYCLSCFRTVRGATIRDFDDGDQRDCSEHAELKFERRQSG